MKIQPKTKDQIGRIFGLARKAGLEMDEDAKAGIAVTVSAGRVDRLSQLSFDEANVAIKHLGGDVFDSPSSKGGVAGASADGVVRGTPRRTVNHHRQQAGVKQIAQGPHIALMRRLAEGRNITEDGLKSLCRRMLQGREWPRTTDDTNKIVEALKAMNARDKRQASRRAA